MTIQILNELTTEAEGGRVIGKKLFKVSIMFIYTIAEQVVE